MANTLLAIQYSATPAETKKPSTSEMPTDSTVMPYLLSLL